MPERVLLLGDDLRAFLAIARSPGRRAVEVHATPSDWRLRQMSPNLTAEMQPRLSKSAADSAAPCTQAA